MYEPEVDDYVVWERETWVGIERDEGWVYFKGDPVEPKKGFATQARYITIETHITPKNKDELATSLHENTHSLLLCYEQDWKHLKFIKKRKSRVIQHYSQYDDIAGDTL